MAKVGVLGKRVARSKRLAAPLRVGKQALKGEHRKLLEEDRAAAQVTDSLDLDASEKAGHEDKPRWDYLVGVRGSAVGERVVAVEVHPATAKEVKVLLAKKLAAQVVLKAEQQAGLVDGGWHWLASKDIGLTRNTAEARRLQQAGIEFPRQRLVLARELS
jgi:hypothetical protein